uniref:Uncharacterized protein n=1 Tax=Photinus pyralis TaxID=7054 RepID=A0A1Y1LT98_PHOPY
MVHTPIPKTTIIEEAEVIWAGLPKTPPIIGWHLHTISLENQTATPTIPSNQYNKASSTVSGKIGMLMINQYWIWRYRQLYLVTRPDHDTYIHIRSSPTYRGSSGPGEG